MAGKDHVLAFSVRNVFDAVISTSNNNNNNNVNGSGSKRDKGDINPEMMLMEKGK